MPMKIQRYGWRPDTPDQRDQTYRSPSRFTAKLPASIDLRIGMPMIWDQLDLGSCTANSTGAQVWFLDKTNPAEPSRLFIYYNTRVLEGTRTWDSGASIRNSIKSVVKWGFCDEALWPYSVRKFTRKPTNAAYKDAKRDRVSIYSRIQQTAKGIKGALAEGFPVNFGFSVYTSFEDESVAKSGIMMIPKPNEELLGGHAVLIVGYDDERQHYIVRNSWGTDWGDKGYFYMPYTFVHDRNYCADFWIVRAVP
jgi:C1A family cysteine protease